MEFRKQKLARFCSFPKRDIESSEEKDGALFFEKWPSVNEQAGQDSPSKAADGRADKDSSECQKQQARALSVLDPGGKTYLQWNRFFLFWCLVGLFIDALFFLLPSVLNNSDGTSCVYIDPLQEVIMLSIRTVTDVFYTLNIIIKFRTAYVSPTSRVLGKGELVTDTKMIAEWYLKSGFWLDLVAALPLLEIVVWLILPASNVLSIAHRTTAIVVIVMLQLLPKIYIVISVSSLIIKAAGVIMKTGFAGATYNLFLYILGGHMLGSSWYLQSLDRELFCWKSVCHNETSPFPCYSRYFDCSTLGDSDRTLWANATAVFNNCSSNFNYGIYGNAMINNVFTANFIYKYFYSLWWGVNQLGCLGQNLTTSIFIGENTFAVFVSTLGLIFFSFMIANVQTYLQSITVRVEEWRLKRHDTRHWMKHRNLPEHLRERVRRYIQYKWHATRGVDEEAIVSGLPTDLRRDIQRHLCLDLVRRVPFFAQMDGQLLDAICGHLVACLCIRGTLVVREGDLVTEMLFIVRGRLESSTTNGGITGFFNSITMGPGDFCGEELLSWALLSKSSLNFPISTRTVSALTDVEAFALKAEDLNFVANQFRRLHSKKLQHTFRFHSHHWRMWAACFIQAAWRRHRKRMMGKNLCLNDSSTHQATVELEPIDDDDDSGDGASCSNATRLRKNRGVMILASSFEANRMRGMKPKEPDFSIESIDDFSQTYLQ